MAKASNLQNTSFLGSDEAEHCKVIVEKIGTGDKSAALIFIDFYNQRKQKQILKKHVPKAMHHSFMFIANTLAQSAKQAIRN